MPEVQGRLGPVLHYFWINDYSFRICIRIAIRNRIAASFLVSLQMFYFIAN